MPNNCIFCRIGNGEIQTEFLYRDDNVCAINDINPVAPVHVLIFPIEHISELRSTGAEDNKSLGQILVASKKVADIMGINGTGFRTVINQGSDSGQEIEHLHAHVIGGRLLGSIG